MQDVTLAHAKEHLEELIEKAARGEVVRIADGKHAPVRLLPEPVPDVLAPRVTDTMPPFVPLKEPRKLGRHKGKYQVPERLMEPMSEEELKDWYGEDT